MIGFSDLLLSSLTALLYGLYLYSGLALLGFASCPTFLSQHLGLVPQSILNNFYISWDWSIYLLAAGNFCHAMLLFGWTFALKFFFVSAVVIIAVEEYGLYTGNVFGDYYFPDGGLEGPRFNGNLPWLVLALWHALLYPCFLMSLVLFSSTTSSSSSFTRKDGNNRSSCSSTRSSYSVAIWIVLVASVLLTFFDAFSEPTSAMYGHRVWFYWAFDNPDDHSCVLGKYTKSPDWVFYGADKAVSLLLPAGMVNVLNYKYLTVPLQNSFGWLGASILTLSITLYCTGIPQNSNNQGLGRFFNMSAVLVNFCTAIFYLIHPCHPLLVKILSSFYIILLLPLYIRAAVDVR